MFLLYFHWCQELVSQFPGLYDWKTKQNNSPSDHQRKLVIVGTFKIQPHVLAPATRQQVTTSRVMSRTGAPIVIARKWDPWQAWCRSSEIIYMVANLLSRMGMGTILNLEGTKASWYLLYDVRNSWRLSWLISCAIWSLYVWIKSRFACSSSCTKVKELEDKFSSHVIMSKKLHS